MTNNFIAEYNELKNIRSAYDSAETEVEKNAARGDFKAFKERIAAKGSDYSKYFWIFEDAWRRGNNYIDFNDVPSASENSPFPPHGRARLKQHGFLPKTAACLKEWLKSTASTRILKRTSTKKSTLTFSISTE